MIAQGNDSCLAWLIGIWLASRVVASSIAPGFPVGVTILRAVLWRRALGLRWMFILALAAMLGALRYNLAQPHFDYTSLATYNDQQKLVIVESVVVGEPDARDTLARTNLRVEADHLLISNLSDSIIRP